MRLSAICHDIRSVHNVGSIFRTADAAGVEKIYLCGITPNPHDRFGKVRSDFAKVSLGAENSVAFESVKSTEEAIQKLKAENWTILALEQSENSIPYDQVPISHTLNPKKLSEKWASGPREGFPAENGDLPTRNTGVFRGGNRRLQAEMTPRGAEFPPSSTFQTASKICLLLGSEVSGLPPSVLVLADHVIEIPMRGKKESLNVAVAFGIAAFEIVRKGAVDRCA